MKKHFKRSGKSAISIVLSAMILLSAMVINPGIASVDTVETSVATTAAAESVEDVTTPENSGEAADVQTTKEEETEAPETEEQTPASSEKADQTSAVTVEENAVTVDVTPAEVKSTVLTVDDIKGEAANDTAAEENTAVVKNTKPEKKLPEASGTSYTYYFDNSGNWSEVYIHAWSGSTNLTGDWMTTKMNYDGTLGLYYYSFEDTTPTGFIFCGKNKDGSDRQTGDITTIVSGNVYKYTSNNSTTNVVTGQTAQNYSNTYLSSNTYYTVYFVAPSDAVYARVHAWKGSTNYNGAWADNTYIGYIETLSDGTKLFGAKVNKNASNMIFRWGDSNNRVTNQQTADLTISSVDDGKVYLSSAVVNTGSTEQTPAEYKSSIAAASSGIKTIYFSDDADWSGSNNNQNIRICVYCYSGSASSPTNANAATSAGIEISQDSTHLGLYSFSTTENYDYVVFSKNGSSSSSERTTAATFVNGRVYSNKDLSNPATALTAANAAYYPAESTLNDDDNGADAYLYWSNSDQDVVSNGSNSIVSGIGSKQIQSVTDANGRTWYYAEFTPAEVGNNLYFALGKNSTAFNVSSNIVVKTSSNIALGSGRQEQGGSYFGKTWTKKKITKLRIYVNSISSDDFF